MDEMKQTMACDETTYSAVVHGCAQTRNWTAAERLLAEMREEGFTPNDACYYALLAAASKAGELKLAERLLDRMRAEGLPPDLYAYSTVFGGCGRFHEWRLAMRLLELMRSENISPTRKIFNSALRACGSGEAEVAEIFLEMSKRNGIDADASGCAMAIVAFGRGGRVDKALALLDRMRKSGPPPNGEWFGLMHLWLIFWGGGRRVRFICLGRMYDD